MRDLGIKSLSWLIPPLIPLRNLDSKKIVCEYEEFCVEFENWLAQLEKIDQEFTKKNQIFLDSQVGLLLQKLFPLKDLDPEYLKKTNPETKAVIIEIIKRFNDPGGKIEIVSKILRLRDVFTLLFEKVTFPTESKILPLKFKIDHTKQNEIYEEFLKEHVKTHKEFNELLKDDYVKLEGFEIIQNHNLPYPIIGPFIEYLFKKYYCEFLVSDTVLTDKINEERKKTELKLSEFIKKHKKDPVTILTLHKDPDGLLGLIFSVAVTALFVYKINDIIHINPFLNVIEEEREESVSQKGSTGQESLQKVDGILKKIEMDFTEINGQKWFEITNYYNYPEYSFLMVKIDEKFLKNPKIKNALEQNQFKFYKSGNDGYSYYQFSLKQPKPESTIDQKEISAIPENAKNALNKVINGDETLKKYKEKTREPGYEIRFIPAEKATFVKFNRELMEINGEPSELFKKLIKNGFEFDFSSNNWQAVFKYNPVLARNDKINVGQNSDNKR